MAPPGFVLPEGIEPVVITPDFYIGLEVQDGVTLVHCSVWRWGVDVARAVRAAMDRVATDHGGPLFGAARRPHGDDHAKFDKFCRLCLGAEFHRTVRVNGEDHAVYVRWR